MIVGVDGRVERVGSVLMTHGYFVLTEDQFLVITKDERLELWEGKKDYLVSHDPSKCNRVGFWTMDHVVAFLKEQKYVQ